MKAWWRRVLERRSLSGSWRTLWEGVGATETAAGVTVTPEAAAALPTVFACLQVLAQDVAKTPVKLRRQVAPDTFEDAREHDLWEILHDLPNPEMTAYSFKHQMMLQLLTYGRAYAQIVRVDGRVVSLWPLETAAMRVDRDAARRKRWTYRAGGETHVWTFDASMPPIFELTHDTPLVRCRELLGTALALQTYLAKFFANGARLTGVLQSPRALGDKSIKNLRESFNALYQGTSNAFKVAVLENDVKFQAIAAPNDEAQLNETMQSLRIDIAGMFRVPPHKIGDLSKATYSNMEAGAIEYVTGALDPYFTCWEQAIRRDLLTTRQYGRYDVAFDRQSLIRSDMQSLHAALATGRQAGFYSANDARRALGLNPIPGGDEYLVNSALVPVAPAGAAGRPS